MNYAQWYDHRWYPYTKREGEATLALVVILNNHCWCCCYGDYYCPSPYYCYCCCYYCNQHASLVDMIITDHNNPHDNGHCHNEPRVPGEHMYCSTASVVELRSSKEIVATFGWLEDPSMLVNRLQFFLCFILFPVFHVNFVTFVGAACQCLSMLGTIVFMNWFIMWGLSWTPFEDSGQLDWTEINVAKSKFSMLKSIEMRHPEHPSSKVQLHPAEEQDLETTLTLEKHEELVGFQFFEAKQGAQKTYKVKMSSSLFKEVFNKSAQVGAMEKRDHPVR